MEVGTLRLHIWLAGRRSCVDAFLVFNLGVDGDDVYECTKMGMGMVEGEMYSKCICVIDV
jgi:hypothetical protein